MTNTPLSCVILRRRWKNLIDCICSPRKRETSDLQSAQSDMSEAWTRRRLSRSSRRRVNPVASSSASPRYGRCRLAREVAFFYLASAHTSVHSIVHAFHEIHSWAQQSGRSVKALGRIKHYCSSASTKAFVCTHRALNRGGAHWRLIGYRTAPKLKQVIRSSLSLKLRIGTRTCLDRMPMFSIPCALVHRP